jgi:arylsulfatase A-like enzyme
MSMRSLPRCAKMIRYTLTALSLLVCALLLRPVQASAQSKTSQQPNIIVVLIDDAGYADYSSYGNQRVQTVNIDRMAAEGLRFAQFYVNSPICSPSRTALVTGQYPARWRITSYLANRALNEKRGMAQFLDPAAPVLARLLKGAGYRTGHFGKWHLGGGRDVGEAPLPTEYGFDASLTQFEGLGNRILPIFDAHDGTPARKAPLGLASERLGRGKVTWLDRCQVTRAFVDRALEFIKQAEGEGKPFYVNLWPDDVHSPFFPPPGTRGDGSKHALYDAVLKNMDAQLGPLFDYLRGNPKLRNNTLVLITNDNGPEEGAGSAGAFRNGKGTLYEGGVREPLIVWGPGWLPSARRGAWDRTTVLSSVDLVPSLLKLAGVTPPSKTNFDGVDVSAALLGKAIGPRAKPLFWKRPPDRPGPPDEHWPDLAARDREWKLLLNEDGSGAQLYHILRDPAESINLAAQHPDVVRRLSEAARAWNRTLPQ